jgi:5-methylcytosine-specific restriction endonuclease McrA
MPAHTDTWPAAREAAIERDGARCTVSLLIGGECSPTLHVHHVVPRSEGGSDELENLLTACASHHPMLEALRRYVLAKRKPRRCGHYHRYRMGREECERRMTERV